MKIVTLVLIALGTALPGCGSDTTGKAQATPVGDIPTPVRPGVCAGARTQCTAPPAEQFELGPLVTCQATEPGTGEVVWSADLGRVDCPLGKCTAIARGIANDPNGSLWVLSDLMVPDRDNLAGGTRFGTGLSRYDAKGQLVFTIVADFRTRLGGKAAFSSSMRVDARGHLMWVAPTPGAPGLELRDYDAAGRPFPARRLVDWAPGGQARIEEDDSVVLAYEHGDGESHLGDGGIFTTDPNLAASGFDIARLDASGALVWNQTVSSILGFGQLTSSLSLGFGTRSTLLTARIDADVAPLRGLVAELDADGNVTWIHQQNDAQFDSLVALPAGGAGVAFSTTSDPAAAAYFLVRLDEHGTSEWALDLAGFNAFPSPSIPVATDRENRFWGTEWPFLGKGFEVDVVAADGLHCASWSLDAAACVTLDDGASYCTGLQLAPRDDGTVSFAAGTTVGVARFGGMP